MNKSNYITLHAVNVAFINYYKVSMKFAFFFSIKQLTSSNRAYKGTKKLMVFLEMYHVCGMETSLSYISLKRKLNLILFTSIWNDLDDTSQFC